MNKLISVIGGSGFVGSRLISELKPDNCYIIDKNESPFFNDICEIQNIIDYESFKLKNNTEVVVLLAAEHRDDVQPKSLYFDVNVNGTTNVLKKMDELGVKNLVFTSSVAVYGLGKDNPDENHLVDPFNDYGISKWEAEKVIQDWYNNDPIGKSVTIVRPSVIFGERNRGNVFNLFKQICSGKFLMIGDGENRKSMAYVGNVVAFLKNRIETRQLGYNIYNYADKPDYSMIQLVNLIENKFGIRISKIKIPFLIGLLGGYCFDFLAFLTKRKFSISSIRVKKFCATTQFDSTKAHLAFKTPNKLEDGLIKTLEFEFRNEKKDDVLFFSE